MRGTRTKSWGGSEGVWKRGIENPGKTRLKEVISRYGEGRRF